MSLLRQSLLLARSDLRQELRQLELSLTAGFFTLVLLAMFGVSFGALRPAAHKVAVPGLLWLTVAFVGAMTLTRLFDREREHDTLTALLAAPVERLAILLAKGLVALVVLVACCAVVVPGLALLFPAAGVFLERPLLTAALVLSGCLGYVAVGTVFAAALGTGLGRGVLLSVIMYPLTTPVLLFALVATRALLESHPGAAVYLGQLAALDVVLLAVSLLVFEHLLVPTRGQAGATAPRRARGGRS